MFGIGLHASTTCCDDVNNVIVLQQSLNKSLSFQDGPTGGTSFVNIYQNVRLDP